MAKGADALRLWIRAAPGGGPIVVAHRGARAFAPENTISAFAKAFELGCTMIELDVHFSSDGHLVVHHDDDLTRCTDVRRRFPGRESYFVSDFTLSEIKDLDAGSWFAQEFDLPPQQRQPFLRTLTSREQATFITEAQLEEYRKGQVRVPTLGEVLEFARHRGLLVNIEIKSIPRMYPGIARRVIDDVRANGMVERVLVSSFDHKQILESKRLEARMATGVLTSDRLARISDYMAVLGADAYHPGCYGDYDSIGFSSVTGEPEVDEIASLLRAGGLVFVWTCNDPAQIRRLQAVGVTGIITDFPNRVVP